MSRDITVKLLFYRETDGFGGVPFHEQRYVNFSPPTPLDKSLVSIGGVAYEVVETCTWYRRYTIEVGISVKQAMTIAEILDEPEPEPSVEEPDEEPSDEEEVEDLDAEVQAAQELLSGLHDVYMTQKGESDGGSGTDI